MRTTLHAAITGLARAGLTLQGPDGSTPPGHNGAHGDPELPSRNTGHWLLNWSFAWQHGGDPAFEAASHAALDYLVRPEHRPGGHTVHHRTSAGKDKCNGLMGPAFSIESLAEGGARLGRADAIDLAGRLARMHPFDEGLGLWQVREIDGSLPGIDWTLNHQLWFAAAVAMADRARGDAVSVDVRAFIDQLDRLMVLRPNGRVRHLAENLGRGARLRAAARRYGLVKQSTPPADKEVRREIAYHLFNLAPIALLARAVPGASFWTSSKLRAAIDYLDSDEYMRAVDDPAFVRPHIPAGFPLSFAERAMVNQVFGPPDIGRQRAWLERQFARTFDFDRMSMILDSADPVTQAARSYELTRVEDVDLDLPIEVADHAAPLGSIA